MANNNSSIIKHYALCFMGVFNSRGNMYDEVEKCKK